MAQILLDSGVLVALFDKDDNYHIQSVDFIKNNRSPLVTTVANITEAMYLLSFSLQAQLNSLQWLSLKVVYIHPVLSQDLTIIAELTKTYADLPMDFADACLVMLAEKLKITEIATIDSDFLIYRIDGKKNLKNVFNKE